MYTRYAESRKWRVSIMNVNRTGIGGFKEIIFEINGSRVYNNLKYESGVHRVQRIPETEKSGRVHTSTVTVVVLPEAEAVDIEVKPEQIRIDVFRSSGHGGQSVNTTDSAVRITYLPTGMMVTCQDENRKLKPRKSAQSSSSTLTGGAGGRGEQNAEMPDGRRLGMETAPKKSEHITFLKTALRITESNRAGAISHLFWKETLTT